MQQSLIKLFDEVRELSERIATCKANIVAAQTQIIEDEERIEEIKKVIKGVSRENSVSEKAPYGYNSDWPNIMKAVFVIREKGYCLSVKEVCDTIAAFEQIDDTRKYISSLSSALSTDATKKGKRVLRYQEFDGGDWLYGPKEWFNGEGAVKPEYTFKNKHPHG